MRRTVYLLCFLLSACASPRFSYKEAHRTERRYNKAVRYYRRLNHQTDKELAKDRKEQAKRLKKDHP